MSEKELKELLGEELYNQFMDKIGDKPISIGGGKIPYSRFNEVNTKAKDLESKVTELTAQVETLTAENKTLKAQVKSTQTQSKVNDIIKDSGAKNTVTVMKLLDLGNVEDTEDSLKSVQDKIDALKKTDPYLFNNNKVTGNTPNTTNIGGGNITKEDFAKMNYRERVSLYERDKALYDSLVQS